MQGILQVRHYACLRTSKQDIPRKGSQLCPHIPTDPYLLGLTFHVFTQVISVDDLAKAVKDDTTRDSESVGSFEA